MRAFTPKEVSAMLRKPKGRVRNVAAKEDRTYNGRVYHSKAEALYAFKLDALKSSGKIRDWQPQVVFHLRVRDELICKFIVDFRVIGLSGEVWFVEVKGWPTPEYKLAAKLFRALYPDIDYRVVKA